MAIFRGGRLLSEVKILPALRCCLKMALLFLGLCVVIICVYLGHRFTIPYLDGVASQLVGLLLVAASIILACESRSLLMGEGIEKTTQQKIISIIESDPSAVKMMKVFSSYQSPEDVFLILCVQFKKALRTQ